MRFIDSEKDHQGHGNVDHALVIQWLNKARNGNPDYTFEVFSDVGNNYDYCLCNHDIENNFVAHCPATGNAVVLGSRCIQTARNAGMRMEVVCSRCKEKVELKCLSKKHSRSYLCRRCTPRKKSSSTKPKRISEISEKSSADPKINSEISEKPKLMGFGKYRSMTYEEVYRNQRSYIRWFLSDVKDCTGHVLEFKEWLYEKEGLCLGCDKKAAASFMGRCGFEVCLDCYVRMESEM
jgi:hypothetical protein